MIKGCERLCMYYIVNFPKYAETATVVQRAAFIMSGLQGAILARQTREEAFSKMNTF